MVVKEGPDDGHGIDGPKLMDQRNLKEVLLTPSPVMEAARR